MNKIKQWYLKRYTDYFKSKELIKSLNDDIDELIRNPKSYRSLTLILLRTAKEANEKMMLNFKRKREAYMNYSKGTEWEKQIKTPNDLPKYYQRFEDKCTFCGACCRRAGKIPDFPEPVDENGVCVHLTKDNKCAIYDKRPLMCRTDDSFGLVRFNYKNKRWYVKSTIDRCNAMIKEDGLDKKFLIKDWNELTEKGRKEYETT